jgi:hypothetical protein
MEEMLGISLYSYPYPEASKMMSFILSLMISLQQNQTKRGWNRFCLEVWREGAQRMYTHVNKCKNDKIKGEKINKNKI